ncbi:MAG: ABC transporter permease, partial [Alistipes sp.]|nr:ABC transporter permease [Alistipes sp.]
MGKLNLAYFMARRMTTATGGSKNNVMVKIAMLSVAIGAAVMIIALAVIFGFKQEIVGRLSGVGAHVQVTHLEGNTSYETAPISRNQPFLDHLSEVQHLKGVYPYAITIGIPQGDKAVSGVIFKGVDSTFDDSFFAQHLVAGTLPRHSDSVRYKDLLISRKLANLLEIEVGDPLRMLFLQQSPRRDRFRISGIYDAAYGELDQIVLTDLSNVQHLNGWDSTQVSGFELTTSDFSRLEEFTDQIYDEVIEAAESEEAHDSLRVENLRERFPMIFDWLNAHNVNA